MKFTGKTLKYGDNVDTDVIIPARYLNTIDKKELLSFSNSKEISAFPAESLLNWLTISETSSVMQKTTGLKLKVPL